MKKRFVDTAIQIESGNSITEDGRPMQVLRRDFGDKVVWFKEPAFAGQDKTRITDTTVVEELERTFQNEF
jgi:hypothetical protein